MSIRIRQPETLDSINCHIFPELLGRQWTFSWHYSTLKTNCATGLIDLLAHTYRFIVLCNGVRSDFMACVCMSPPVWLGATELVSFQVNLTPGRPGCLAYEEGSDSLAGWLLACLYNWNNVFSVVYMCLYMVYTLHRLGCKFNVHVWTCFILVHT